ncbi:hypothetical protein [Celeribacter naphthalenivorans]|uniref:hypothetical protein n=1 Tax=Celeribacter naphthalenivorans TaxID=1614694 RepID=UPI001CFA0A94|nr:hypothetical protein [Celeribacter naphthalenivorans]
MTYHTNSPALTASKAGHVHNVNLGRGTYPGGISSTPAGGLSSHFSDLAVEWAEEVLSTWKDPAHTDRDIVDAVVVALNSVVTLETYRRAAWLRDVMRPVVAGGMQ